MAWSPAGYCFPITHPGWPTGTYWAMDVVTALLFFASVVVHEPAHSFLSQTHGVPVRDITLFIPRHLAHCYQAIWRLWCPSHSCILANEFSLQEERAMEPAQQSETSSVIIQVDTRVFLALVAVIGIALVFGIGLFLGQALRPQGFAGAAAQIAPQRQQVQPGQPFQLQPGQQGTNPFQEPAQSAARPPAGDEVPIGDNPRLAIPELADRNYTYDFGDIAPDRKVERIFTLMNKGTRDLVIQDVSSSCGCTAALVDKDIIPPGGTADILVTYDPRVNKDQGRFITRKVRIKSNDPVVPLAEFTISANVLNQ